MRDKIVLFVAVASVIFTLDRGFAQGSLTPPAAPAPTMKTLSQIEPRTPISGPLPISITSPGSYYLTTNLTGVSGQNGITILTSNVTLDLNGFALLGVPSSGIGLYINGTFTNITMRNGMVSGWGGDGVNGYKTGYSRNVVYEKLSVSTCASGISAEEASIIRDCMVLNNVGTGIYSVGSLVTGCVARDNGNYGIYVNSNSSTGSSAVRSCVSHHNANGIYADHSTVADCDIMFNTVNGVTIVSSCQIINNRIADNTNSGNGIALVFNGSKNMVANNSVLNNSQGVYGASAATNNCIVQNKFCGNATPYNIWANNIFPAVIISPSSGNTFSSSNPWINIFY
ncbi:NosD domain-containing protein [Pedosphaera parvula]|uniref:Periplasmic copper-binding protein NosD beta helix domain-containing protein n=1 Tax=Pedosphaera parvula (strain Ellin514) TaxID=320771 RepID=B9XAC7_PEDPL|nr:right-handed parallel beta-helix repeat-containing protein [Pedosphaera parvula]EEF63468.1 hypothetical protein Cflav_PD6103 [Pedosphaera parvula Ellin514]